MSVYIYACMLYLSKYVHIVVHIIVPLRSVLTKGMTMYHGQVLTDGTCMYHGLLSRTSVSQTVLKQMAHLRGRT